MSNEIGMMTTMVWGVMIDAENAILARFEGLGERFGSDADLDNPHIKTAYDQAERAEVVGVLDIILNCISSDFRKYRREDVEKALRIVSAWANNFGIDVSKKVQHVKALMADVKVPVLMRD